MKNFLFIGGDKRRQYAAGYIVNEGHTVTFADDCPEFESLVAKADYIVLPLPTSRDSVRVNSPLSVAPVSLARVVRAAQKGQTVFAGMPDSSFAQALVSKGVHLYDYYENESLAILNSISTAEGVIFEITGNTDKDIHGSKIAVIGYGKAGSAIARRLAALGAEVTVAARRESARAQAISDMCKATKLYALAKKAKEFDIVINTVPTRVLEEDFIKNLNKTCLIIEVASAPYGVDFEAAEKHGIRVLRVPGLPGRISPQSAGEAIAKTILGAVKI
ncbi:MAG: NAD(P)-binding domain-containing protein [Clostridia bacterium]|nr:NAD(P)-binding domain-containing protein [Clostridia bacterium]